MGFDQISSRFFLTNMTSYANKMENVEWQLSGGKLLANPSLQQNSISILDQMKRVVKVLEKVRENRGLKATFK